MEKKQPEDTIRDGMVKASLWENEGEHGPFISVELAKTYRDQDGELQDGKSFSLNDLLKIPGVVGKAYDSGREIERTMRQMQERSQENSRSHEKDSSRGPDAEAERRAFVEQRKGQTTEPKREPSR